MPRGQGGPSYHKTGCTCIACRARNRAPEAVPSGDGVQASVPAQKVIHADAETTLNPVLKTQDRSKRGRISEFVAYRAADPKLSNVQIAEKIGISVRTLNAYITEATKQGWLTFDDPLSRIEHEIIPQTLDNLSAMLKEGNEKVTIEVAKGTIFHTYKESKSEGKAPSNILVLNIETVAPPNIEVRQVKGTIVGAPKAITAEVVS